MSWNGRSWIDWNRITIGSYQVQKIGWLLSKFLGEIFSPIFSGSIKTRIIFLICGQYCFGYYFSDRFYDFFLRILTYWTEKYIAIRYYLLSIFLWASYLYLPFLSRWKHLAQYRYNVRNRQTPAHCASFRSCAQAHVGKTCHSNPLENCSTLIL